MEEKLAHLKSHFGDIVVIGGAALMLQGVDRVADDLDAWVPTGNLKKGAASGGIPSDTDLTESKYAWGNILIGDIQKSPLSAAGVRCMSLETIYIVKADIARSKDIDDLALIAGHTSPGKIMKRLGELYAFNQDGQFESICETVMQEIQMGFGSIYPEDLADSGLPEEILDNLNYLVTPVHHPRIK